MLIDTHCHLDDQKLINNVDTIVFEYLNNGIKKVINMGCNYASSINGESLSKKYKSVYFAVGIHPDSVGELTDQAIKTFTILSKDSKCVAIGEIGLDYHYQPFDKERQIQVFERQISLARNVKLPVSIHTRDATKDTIDILKENKDKLESGFVIHCFSGSKESAKEYLDLGGYLGFGGTSTFSNAVNVKEVLKYCPIDRILTETDSPYLAPSPYRGQINSPKNILIIAQNIANLRGLFKEETEIALEENAHRLFTKLNNE